MNRTFAAAAAAAIGFSLSSLVAPAVAGAWPAPCLPFIGCVNVPVDPRGALPGFGGLPNGLPGLPGMPAMPAIAAPPMIAPPVVAPPVIAPPVVPVAAPVIAPPVVAPPVVPIAAPPVIAPPVVAPPVIPVAAPSSPIPNMEPLEHSVEGLLNAPAAAPPAPNIGSNMQPLEHTVEGLLNAPAAAPPAAPAPNIGSNMQPLEHTVEGLLNPAAAPAPAAPPAVEASAPPAVAAPHVEAPAPMEAAAPAAPPPAAPVAAPPLGPPVMEPDGINQSTQPEADQICKLTGACGQGLTPAAAPAPAAEAPHVEAPAATPDASPAVAPIPPAMEAADPQLGTPEQQIGGTLPPTASMTSLPQGWSCGGVPDGVSSAGVSSAACGGVTRANSHIPRLTLPQPTQMRRQRPLRARLRTTPSTGTTTVVNTRSRLVPSSICPARTHRVPATRVAVVIRSAPGCPTTTRVPPATMRWVTALLLPL